MAKEAVKDAGAQVDTGKLKALQATIDKIEKDYGKGTIMKLADQPQWDEHQVIPSGSIALDHALGIGGYPKGRIIEIYGPESSGKTTLAIHAIAQAQKQGGIAAMIDAEHAFDRSYAKALGVDLESLLISQPDNGEQALEIADNLIRSGAIDIIVIDSVAALTPKAEIEGEMGDNKVGLQARLMSQALRKLTANISKTNTCCIFINQLREKIGVMFGNPETTTGGNALKFYASVRIDVRRTTQIKDGEEAELADIKDEANVRNEDLKAKKEELSNIVESTAKEEKVLRTKRDACAALIDPRTMSAYERIRQSERNHLAVVSVFNGNACGGCFNTIIPQRLIDIASNKKLVICEHCGRIIVSSEIEEEKA